MQAPKLGSFNYDLQGFQVTFTETVASTYEISAARDGVPGWQVNGTLHYLEAVAGTLSVPRCTLELGGGFQGVTLAAGAVGDVLVRGKDTYGERLLEGHLCMPDPADWHPPLLSPAIGAHTKRVFAGNTVALDFSAQMDAVLPPAPLTDDTFTAALVWQPSPPALAVRINATLATSISLAVSAGGIAIPGSPVDIKVVAGPINGGESELTGAGAAVGEPTEWNPVRFVPRDAFRNIPPLGAVDLTTLALEFTPAVEQIKNFTVRIAIFMCPTSSSCACSST